MVKTAQGSDDDGWFREQFLEMKIELEEKLSSTEETEVEDIFIPPEFPDTSNN